MPYNLGPYNQYDANSTYLSPYDWLYGPYAPPFVLENFDDLAFSEVSPAILGAARIRGRWGERTFVVIEHRAYLRGYMWRSRLSAALQALNNTLPFDHPYASADATSPPTYHSLGCSRTHAYLYIFSP